MNSRPGTFVLKCQICGTEILCGNYTDCTCPECGSFYYYDETQSIQLSAEQTKALRELYERQKAER